MSSISKSPLNNNMISFESSEESSWTKYFEDFFNNDHNNIDGDDHDGGSSTSSLVFDAAEKKLSDHSAQGAMEYNKRLSFKKRKKIKTSLVDHDLEDTASSPINSPKIFKAKEKEEIDQFYEVSLINSISIFDDLVLSSLLFSWLICWGEMMIGFMLFLIWC
ncbi:hypothetical protein KIW84_057042 [Lathyrus oleraceus]|uniref:Uncharacterized protein n=1 Tax=Pisum sativum TaxID=3888 RepID=A0A9D4WZY6_PEA|nr:hypothetical protein KIW84_057042 [Pisum sativum]